MKIHSIAQSLICSQCRASFPIPTCKKVINFTTGEITFYCRSCRAKIGFLSFGRSNALYRDYFEKPARPIRPLRPEGNKRLPRARRVKDRNRSGQNSPAR